MYDLNGNLKQVIRCKCDYTDDITINRNRVYNALPNCVADIGSVETDDIIIVFSLFDGYEINNLLNLLDRRYSK